MQNFWFLNELTLQECVQAQRDGRTPDAAAVERYNMLAGDFDGDANNPILRVVDGVAEISINGILTGFQSRLALMYSLSTPYSAIIDACRKVRALDNIERVDFLYNTPGGAVMGFAECVDEMRKIEVPTRAIVLCECASGGYGLAAQADEILCNDRASLVGSIGVAASVFVFDELVTITSTNAPKKRPDVKTPEGVEMVREELDQFEKLFIEDIAQGRGVSPDVVREQYGKGGSFVYELALAAGMVDGMYEANDKNATVTNTTEDEEVKAMNYDEWAKANPEAARQHEQAQAEKYLSQGRTEGAAAENDRIGALLIRAEAAGEKGMEIVRPLIDKPGETASAKDMARLDMLAVQSRTDADRVSDNPDTGNAAGTGKPGDAKTAEDKQFLREMYKTGQLTAETRREAEKEYPGIFDDLN